MEMSNPASDIWTSFVVVTANYEAQSLQSQCFSVTKRPAFNGTRRWITVFTRPCHWSLPWTGLIHSILVSLIPILRASSPTPLLPSGLRPSNLLTKTLLCMHFSPKHATCHAHFIPFSICWGTHHEVPHYAISSRVGQNTHRSVMLV